MLRQDSSAGSPKAANRLKNSPSPLLVMALRIGALIVFVGSWETASSLKWINPFFVSRPSDIIFRAYTWLSSGYVLSHTAITIVETFFAFVLGALLGAILAFLLYRSSIVDQALMPYLMILNAMPRIIFAPIFILWFGLGLTSKVVLGISIVIFIVFFSIYTGLKEVDQNLINKVRLMGGSEKDVLLEVLIPSALSWLFSSLKTSVGFALVGAIVGEYMGSANGLGHIIAFAEGMFDATGVFAGLFILSFVVIAINWCMERVENHFTAWRMG
ncbi:MAG: ABC transporter permease [Chloroflexi bacterium]|nr:ABC transporter permease [Chloroflexota bacterium]MDA8187764.1 ABC transporter permease [Dehalococcoidales bacterium]